MPSSEALAGTGNALMYAGLTVYTGAFVAYCAEWALGTHSRVNRHAAAEAARLARTPAMVSTAAMGALTAPVAEPPPAGDVPVRSSVAADVAGRIGVALTFLAFTFHTAATLLRGLAARRLPLGNMYEFATAGALAVVAVFLVLLVRRRDRRLGLFVLLPVTLALGLAVTVLYTEAGPLQPSLRSYWLGVHVTAAVLCTGIFTVGAVASALHLGHARLTRRRRPAPGSVLGSALEHLPGPAALDRLAHTAAVFVFPLWTFAIFAGAIWAQSAWGRYWGWDPKETWAFVTWVGYAAYLHARSTAGWNPRGVAWLNLAGYACFLFNFVGVNVFFTGLHSYAGV